jgi:hypothetical protein
MTTLKPNSASERGFGLIEALIATFVTAVGVLSVAALFMVGARMQLNARDSSNAIALVTAELERIRTLPPTAPGRLDGGSLADNTWPNHNALRGTTRLRWVITNKPLVCAPAGGIPGAPAECAKDIQMVAIAPNGQAVSPVLASILYR